MMQRTLAVLALLAVPAVAQNLVLNGSFERNSTSGCAFNLSNPEFTSSLAACTGFGLSSEIDIMEDGTCGYGLAPPQGATKLGIAANNDGISDAFSIRLWQSTIAGRPYKLVFQANSHISDFSPEVGAVEVGLSNSATDFGIKVAELVPSTVAWSVYGELVIAPIAASYLTVRPLVTADCWIHVDDFHLDGSGPAGLSMDDDGSTLRVDGATPGSAVAVMSGPATLLAVLVADELGQAAWAHESDVGIPLSLQAVDLSTRTVSAALTLGGSAEPDIVLGPDSLPSSRTSPPGLLPH